ncbi:hypothetical protein CIB95_10960 [Lottiidibacillus patelloidae]|uniref:YwhD family protein n=1 Tax=Lottiidibacillus patelloidae TaxID=2670334 RepID=A0A263BT30_9BACI|nr:YwhD family protein [Lottiidibacillus patelloidae]OZM56732.1 hypothetical protein CIB95_10960 [Lottiidibacillus patelloidae]
MDLLNNDDKNKKKKGNGFTIITNDPTDGHGGFGSGSAGVLSLSNMSPVIVDTEDGDAYIDMGAMHARSAVEKRIKFLPNREEVPNGKLYWLVWVQVERKEDGPYYAGVASCEMRIDESIRRGYKSLPEHVNNMDKALKGKIIVDHMDEKSKKILADFLKGYDESMWDRSSEQLKADLIG